MPKRIRTKIKKKGLFNRGLFNLAAAVVITVCAALIITTERDCSEKEKELARIQAKIDAYKIENEDMRRTLESDDLSAYMEKIALEERGYAYPNERRFYDTSRDWRYVGQQFHKMSKELWSNMQLEIGKIYTGKVKGITQYGAFVDIDGGGNGMVHISEIANTFVNEIRDHLTEGQDVRVKVIGINEAGKVSLSIKKAVEDDVPQDKPARPAPPKERRSKPNVWEPKKTIPQSEMTFEDMMSHFKQSSEERIGDLKRSTDRKNGTRRK